ncbi:hypothetical protein [Sulfurimonas sp.]|jgi:hypothetical protein|uniref:hypothetical protein n=1 Tax=Sulfurimonas sp. TaxID=2022749 RepID=UPI0025E8A4C0|nr:hypothetical protein [Sulfurimonas sp.]MBT5935283.1 hypothetical protein [Sulfurimonas sp.]
MPQYSLQTILSTFSNTNGNKRTIFNNKPLGGMSSTSIIFLFISLPFIEFGLIFNKYSSELLGLAGSIVAFIVFLSIVMVVIFTITLRIKKKIITKITPSWNHYFSDISLRLVLATGITPYSDFFEYYKEVSKEGMNEESLYKYLQESFQKMKIDNADLIEAMRKDNKLH